MNESRPPLAGVTMTTLMEKDASGGVAGGAGGKITAPKKSATIRIEVKLEAKKKDGENYEFCYPDLFKVAVKNSKIAEGENYREPPLERTREEG